MGFGSDDFEPPKGSDGYLKLKPGETRIRFLGEPIKGRKGWTKPQGKGGKPVRKRDGQSWSMDEVYDPDAIRPFWASAVIDYATKSVRVLEIQQFSIMKQLRTLAKDPDWGEPTGYDVVIVRVGAGFEDTEYTVVPKPKAPLSPAATALWNKTCDAGFDLTRLYDGGDPFSADKPKPPADDFVPNDDDIDAILPPSDEDRIPF